MLERLRWIPAKMLKGHALELCPRPIWPDKQRVSKTVAEISKPGSPSLMAAYPGI